MIWNCYFNQQISRLPCYVLNELCNNITMTAKNYPFWSVALISPCLVLGRFFEVLIGARPEPLWRLLSKVGLLYSLEPIFTVIFVVNMNAVWEKVMSTLRAHIFRRVVIQKVNLFDELVSFLDILILKLNAIFTNLLSLAYAGGVF